MKSETLKIVFLLRQVVNSHRVKYRYFTNKKRFFSFAFFEDDECEGEKNPQSLKKQKKTLTNHR
jgi:hypothetical protein